MLFAAWIMSLPALAQSSSGGVVVAGSGLDGQTNTLFRFEVIENGVVRIEDMGKATGPIDPRDGPPVMPDSARSEMSLSEATMSLILERMQEANSDGPPSRQFGFHLERERLRLQFDQGLPIWLAVLGTIALLGTGGTVVGIALTRKERRRLAEEAASRQRALHAREAERTRIARELHDGPLQDVHALRLLSGTQNDVLGEEAGRIARELRAIAEGLRPPALGRFGLAAALSAHANRVKERHKDVAVALDLDEDDTGPNAIPDVARSALFRIAQESITNAIEHGNASRILVRLDLPEAGGPIVLDIQDNGEGFPWATTLPDFAALADDGHFGLVGMHERVAAIGGTLVMDSNGLDGRGAHVRVTLPDLRRMGLSDPPVHRPRHFVPA
ncbi:sensor histidine kinase [Rubrivirga marina]|uniref:Histidine kinase/HSP90-like ATPase domain-containing protein n=1 Tax=Rubrivirga marina TaxID=1196024 RepID=A0A271J3P3_9BACT|nr:sensor histidine kinase [Rubrivirga marina]PAP78063.1 hypothetical protein BSZ37_17275 [Rubrivirga marina]